ncbi:MFS transporter [Chondromyces crocatus]|uniref:MFS transporter n=2 Tax=Chondromyces crocatus TaxID=52 RepID=A0A0K1EKQ8_CHOCO|nr:MFS transporter [Chondromyces crocatus]AKT41188.1 MFS transporter [Chondromyces crocatus]
MRWFLPLWLGQSVSHLCSGLIGFALGVWVYEQTGSITRFALIALFTTLPGIVLSPFAGVLVDRWDRRRAMMLGDAGAAGCALITALLLRQGSLTAWHVCALMGVTSIFSAIHWPAFSAATTLLVPKHLLGRASGMVQLSQAIAQILAPMFAGRLLSLVRLDGVLLLGVVCYSVAIGTVLLVRMTGRVAPAAPVAGRSSILQEAREGWTYIVVRPGLLGLLIFFAIINFSIGMVQALVTPLILSMASTEVLGVVLSIAGGGMLAGSVLMSLWGGPRRRVRSILAFTLVQGGMLFAVGLVSGVTTVAIGAFFFLFCTPIVIGASQAIWQSKVAIALQGRVFAVRRMIAWSTTPLAYLLAGPMVEHIFKPLVRVMDLSAPVHEGTPAEAGPAIGLLFAALGLCTALAAVAGWFSARLQRVEEELPDAVADEMLGSSSESSTPPVEASVSRQPVA